jgi:hypothetical protein
VTGPSFDLVSGWARQGVPLKVAFRGIDRYFERYYRKGPRRRPVHIDFCDNDVLDAFDEWRRAVGVASPPAKGSSLPAHLTRVVLRLTEARSSGLIGPEFDEWIDRISRELDAVRESPRAVRGDEREALIGRLAVLDSQLIEAASTSLDASTRAALTREAIDELAPFRAHMAPEAYARASESAVARLIRERLGLPTVAFT